MSYNNIDVVRHGRVDPIKKNEETERNKSKIAINLMKKRAISAEMFITAKII